jgi:hypothetical protein
VFSRILRYEKVVDGVLKVELGSDLYIGVRRFYKAFFGEIGGLEMAAIAVCYMIITNLYLA